MNTRRPSTDEGIGMVDGFAGFTPLDEPPARQLPERWRSWGHRGAIVYACLGVFVSFWIGIVVGWTDWLEPIMGLIIFTGLGWISGASWGRIADRMCRRKDEEKLATHERKEEQNRSWSAWLQGQEASR